MNVEKINNLIYTDVQHRTIENYFKKKLFVYGESVFEHKS